MKILIITANYPYKSKYDFIFLKQLIDQFAELGHEPVVVSPRSITSTLLKRRKKYPRSVQYQTSLGTYFAFFPKFISFSNFPLLKNLNLYFFNKAILDTIKENKLDFDIIYSHFIRHSGMSAFLVGKKYNKKYFIATGESSFRLEKNDSVLKETLLNVSGIIAVSSDVKERLLELEYKVEKSKIEVFPNAFDPKKFFPMDKILLREKHGLAKEDFILSFVGWFNHRKGVLRVDQALKEINRQDIKILYLGSGELIPSYKNAIYVGPVQHDTLNEYLNLSDVFVLPTLNEGSCNAIIEAIGAGLPVISSNNSFNDDILDDSYSIRIDSMSILEIKEAIMRLYNDRSLRNEMSINALSASMNFVLKQRGQKILNFIMSKLID